MASQKMNAQSGSSARPAIRTCGSELAIEAFLPADAATAYYLIG